jgi:hypothetical protein
MADKFIIHGAAFYGDGTSSAEATVDGGVGAWNNINIFTGTTPTHGTLVSGDMVYIRSKTSAGADITVSIGAATTLGSATASTWIVDAGTVWSGVNGVLTLTGTSPYTLRTNNHYMAEVAGGLRLVNTLVAANQNTVLTLAGTSTNLQLDYSASSTSLGSMGVSGSSRSFHTNLHVIAGRTHSNGALILTGESVMVTLVNPRFENVSDQVVTIAVPGRNSVITIYGGKTTGLISVAIRNGSGWGHARFFGHKYPSSVDIHGAPSTIAGGPCSVFGADDGPGSGAATAEAWGFADSRDDGNFPTLNATLPDSVATPWSWKLSPRYTTSVLPCCLIVGKTWQGAENTITATLEFLVANTYPTLNNGNTWMQVMYTDATTGESRAVGTRVLGGEDALSASTANWSADYYGAINCTKRKLSISTPTAVKQDTLVTVGFFSTATAASSVDLIFLCPDVVLV